VRSEASVRAIALFIVLHAPMKESRNAKLSALSSYLERWKAPTSVVTRHGDTIYVSGLPPFDLGCDRRRNRE
jgi:hypothetical protein